HHMKSYRRAGPLAWQSHSRGRARCPQIDSAGTKVERGHSCPQQGRTVVDLLTVPIPLTIRELLQTRMSALRRRPQNLGDLRRPSHRVVQRAGTGLRRAGDSAPYPCSLMRFHREGEISRGRVLSGTVLLALLVTAPALSASQPIQAATNVALW